MLHLQRLSELVTKEHLSEGRVYPPLSAIREVSTSIAVAVSEFAYKAGLALLQPEPKDKRAAITESQYCTEYADFVPPVWDWPAGQS